ncbi:hypothetical protein P171DRAFT_198011 [Karstenula rhodostoma CBS 690.94]|uniref:Uncharacterized protein n=1 Tax=Karstenula rhodostoma CBS 690.94 TaxID=1392251 RepID=A0A9P4UHK9_9PLEO|nr:hypothetical protein P171DRAFT_198011 [Karstenula rhodostoma CBS 690.94]
MHPVAPWFGNESLRCRVLIRCSLWMWSNCSYPDRKLVSRPSVEDGCEEEKEERREFRVVGNWRTLTGYTLDFHLSSRFLAAFESNGLNSIPC